MRDLTATVEARLPDFIAVGPPRSATTWLEWKLRAHVQLPLVKETDFFGANYDLGLQWYLSHFAAGRRSQPLGEICPTYFDSASARERIARHIPACRVICTLREPVARLYSHYRLLRHEGLANGSLQATLKQHRRASGAGNLFNSSRYADHIREWQRLFGSANVLVLLHDDLETDAAAFLSRLCAFIGIEPLASGADAEDHLNQIARAPRSPRLAARARSLKLWLIRRRRYQLLNRLQPLWEFCAGGGASFPPLAHELEVSLRAELRGEVEALEQLLQRDLSRWKDGGAAQRRPNKRPAL